MVIWCWQDFPQFSILIDLGYKEKYKWDKGYSRGYICNNRWIQIFKWKMIFSDYWCGCCENLKLILCLVCGTDWFELHPYTFLINSKQIKRYLMSIKSFMFIHTESFNSSNTVNGMTWAQQALWPGEDMQGSGRIFTTTAWYSLCCWETRSLSIDWAWVPLWYST